MRVGTCFAPIQLRKDVVLPFLILLAMNGRPIWSQIKGWTSLGPEGGSIETVTIDPREPSTLYVGAEFGSFKSTDAGGSWVKSTLPNRRLVFNPQDPLIIYAQAQWSFGNLLKSADGGTTWKDTGPAPVPFCVHPPAGNVSDFVMDQQDPKTVFVATSCGVFKSVDGAESWRAVNVGLASLHVRTLVMDPQNSIVLYAGTEAGVFKSTDGGESWRIIRAGTDTTFALAVDPSNSATIYVAPWGEAVFKSIDGGETWSAASSVPKISVYAVVVDPQNPGVIYAGGGFRYPSAGGLFKSSDGGESWVDTGLKGVLSFVVDPKHSGTLYVGTNGAGLLKSIDGARTWIKVNSGLLATSVRLLAVDPQNPSTVFVTMTSTLWSSFYGNEVFKSNDGGVNWNAVPGLRSSGIYVMAIDPQRPRTIYAGGGGGLFKSPDAGESWVSVGPAGIRVTAVALGPKNSSVVYVGTDDSRILRSIDGGQTWVMPDFAFIERERGTGTIICSPAIYSLAVDSQNPDLLYVGTDFCSDQGVPMWRSTDGGTTWARRPLVANGLSNFMAVDPQNPNTVYVGTWPGVAKSADGGETWTVASFGPPQFFFVQSLAIDPQSPNLLYATIYLPYPIFQSAVFKSIDSGSTWIPFSNGLSDLNIGTLAIASHGPNILYAGTSQGLFRITDDTPVISLDATQAP